MRQPLPAIGFAFGFAAIQAIPPNGHAVSPEAVYLSREALTARQAYERSQSLFGAKGNAISQLLRLESEFSGGDGHRPHPAATAQAESFIRAWPNDLPLPEFSVEPDGAIAMDWMQSRSRVISVSIGATNRLAYAWVDGTDKGHGVVRFNADCVPSRLVDEVAAIMRHSSPSHSRQP